MARCRLLGSELDVLCRAVKSGGLFREVEKENYDQHQAATMKSSSQKKATARFNQACPMCEEPITKGMRIKTYGRAWVHLDCANPTRSSSGDRPWLKYVKK
jgi:hypothetical protein